ncbi:MAG: hypothetical protein QME42_10820 [bacterium]|nr:hypothetical protein [bacterium]
MFTTYEKEPILKIDVINPINEKEEKSVEFMVDTGASGIIVIPTNIIGKLKLTAHKDDVSIINWEGKEDKVSGYKVNLSLENSLPKEFEVVSTNGPIGLIGDRLLELNKYVFLWDIRNRGFGIFRDCAYLQSSPTLKVELSD